MKYYTSAFWSMVKNNNVAHVIELLKELNEITFNTVHIVDVQ